MYSPELVAALLEAFETEKDPKKLALQFNLPERSVISKLSSLGVHKKRPYLNKLGQLPIKKDEYISRISRILGANVDSLSKVNKSVLAKLYQTLHEQAQPSRGEDLPV